MGMEANRDSFRRTLAAALVLGNVNVSDSAAKTVDAPAPVVFEGKSANEIPQTPAEALYKKLEGLYKNEWQVYRLEKFHPELFKKLGHIQHAVRRIHKVNEDCEIVAVPEKNKDPLEQSAIEQKELEVVQQYPVLIAEADALVDEIFNNLGPNERLLDEGLPHAEDASRFDEYLNRANKWYSRYEEWDARLYSGNRLDYVMAKNRGCELPGEK